MAVRIAHNIAISSSTRLHRREKTEDPNAEGMDQLPANIDAEQEAVRNEQRRALAEAIRTLPAADRQIILLQLEGLSYAEIEQISGLSQSAVATRLSRVRERLKEKVLVGGMEQR